MTVHTDDLASDDALRTEPAYDVSAVLEAVEDLAARLDARDRERIRLDGFRRAAVLVPLVARPQGPELLFTVRAEHLPHHPGQIAFPGGGLEEGEDLVAAALRETHEEVGLVVDRASVVGLLDDHPSPAGYVATPVVAWIDAPVDLERAVTLDPREVDAWFAAPLADLAAIRSRSELRRQPTFQRRIHTFDWRDRRIWGFTGNVVKNLLDVLSGRTATWDQ